MIKQKDLDILSNLRKNGRATLTSLSRKTSVPISTIYDRLKLYTEKNLVKKYVTLLDYALLGYNTRANIIVKAKKEKKEELREFLENHPHVNSLYKINNKYDFQIEVIFRNIKDLEEFLEQMEEKFGVKAQEVFYVIEELKREEFLSQPDLVKPLFML